MQQLLGGDTAKKTAQGHAALKPVPRRPREATPRRATPSGAESATPRRRADTAAADTTPVAGGVLGGLIQQAGAVAGTATPGEYVVPETAFPRVDSLINIPAVARQLPRGVVLRWSAAPTSVGVQQYRFLYVLDDRPIVTGSNLEDARRPARPADQRADRHLPARPRGRAQVRRRDGRHVGDYMAILLDGRVQGRPPVIQSRIGRNGQITLGNKSLQEAQDLALTLKAGALPIPLKIVEERQVGASLGSDSIRKGITAGVVGHGDGDPDHAGVLPA